MVISDKKGDRKIQTYRFIEYWDALSLTDGRLLSMNQSMPTFWFRKYWEIIFSSNSCHWQILHKKNTLLGIILEDSFKCISNRRRDISKIFRYIIDYIWRYLNIYKCLNSEVSLVREYMSRWFSMITSAALVGGREKGPQWRMFCAYPDSKVHGANIGPPMLVAWTLLSG